MRWVSLVTVCSCSSLFAQQQLSNAFAVLASDKVVFGFCNKVVTLVTCAEKGQF